MASAPRTELPAAMDALRTLPPAQEAAWLGLLKAHAELTRALDAALAARHRLSLSSYEVLSRLAHAEHGSLRMSELAGRTGLSVSRVSRLVDSLQSGGLVRREACARDSRVVYAAITDEGRRLVGEAQDTFFAVVDERFLGRLSCDEVALIGGIFTRLVSDGPPPDTRSGG